MCLMEPNEETNNGFAELSSLARDIEDEADSNLSPTQALTEDGTVVELGENGDNSVQKNI